MKKLVLCFFIICPVWALAFLPPVAEHRSKEVFEYRQRKKAEYADRQEEHEERMVATRLKAEQVMSTPPWRQGPAAKLSGAVAALDEQAFGRHNRHLAKRLGVSAVALVLIAAFVLYVRRWSARQI